MAAEVQILLLDLTTMHDRVCKVSEGFYPNYLVVVLFFGGDFNVSNAVVRACVNKRSFNVVFYLVFCIMGHQYQVLEKRRVRTYEDVL